MKNVTFRALSPDGFDCFMDEAHPTRQEAEAAIRRFASRFEKQGYYSGMNGRIHFAKIAENCRIIEIVQQ